MDELSQTQRAAIVKALEERGVNKPCPRCGNSTFSLVGGYFNHFIQTQLGGVSIGGPSIPTAVVVCSKCGWLAEHALGVLNLLPDERRVSKDGEP